MHRTLLIIDISPQDNQILAVLQKLNRQHMQGQCATAVSDLSFVAAPIVHLQMDTLD